MTTLGIFLPLRIASAVLIMADQKKFQGSAYQDLLHDLSSQLVNDKVLPGIEIVGIEKQTNGRLDMVIKAKDQSLVRLDDSKSLEQIPVNQTDAILKQFAPIEIAQKDGQATAPQTEAQLRTGNTTTPTDGLQPQKVDSNQTYVPIEPVLKPRKYVNTIDFNNGGNENSVPVPPEVVK